MRKVFYIFSTVIILVISSAIFSCQQACLNNVFLETLKFDLQVNANNLGISSFETKNVTDTIRSEQNQFYNYGEYRRFGEVKIPSPSFFVTNAYAADDCPETVEYTSKMDASKTKFWINIDYDASALGEGSITANTDLLANTTIKSNYLQGFETNPFLLGGAETPLNLNKEFFQPINQQWITFYFSFEEIDGTVFMDSTVAFVDMSF